MCDYFRPLVQFGASRPGTALPLAGGPGWFTHVEHLRRDAPARIVSADAVPACAAQRLSMARRPPAGLRYDRPQVMGILNVTPDSFSDGGSYDGVAGAQAAAAQMIAGGADILDIGGESTRPGAEAISKAEEIGRVLPVIRAIRAQSAVCLSIDTRKAGVARQAVDAGAGLVNDVSGLRYDPAMAEFCASAALPVCVMHMQGEPATMQQAPRYADVLLDVYDHLETRIAALGRAGIPRSRIIVDPGIGFGKTQAHNLALLRGISLLHGLGCAILLGVSRKGFIGRIGGAEDPRARFPGSLAVALAAIAQGVQIVRVHDVAQTAQALRLWQAVAR